jgi:hypothetical protein
MMYAFDPDTGNIVGSKLTTERVGDETALPGLIAEIDTAAGRSLADGAYDGEGISACLAAKLGHDIEIVVPSPKIASRSTDRTMGSNYWGEAPSSKTRQSDH